MRSPVLRQARALIGRRPPRVAIDDKLPVWLGIPMALASGLILLGTIVVSVELFERGRGIAAVCIAVLGTLAFLALQVLREIITAKLRERRRRRALAHVK